MHSANLGGNINMLNLMNQVLVVKINFNYSWSVEYEKEKGEVLAK